MQRLDLIQTLERVSRELLTPEIISLCKPEFMKVGTGNAVWNSSKLLPLLITSKSQYDSLMLETNSREVLTALGADAVYSTTAFADVVRQVSAATTTHDLFFKKFSQVYAFHSALETQLQMAKRLLVNDAELLEESPATHGVLLFHLTDHNNLTTFTLSKIVALIGDLVQLIAALTSPSVESSPPTVVLLDSGSSATIGLKTSVETAKTVSELFREMWQWWIYRKHFDNKVTMESVATNLSILKTIKEAENANILTPEKAKEYATLIQRKTDDLLDLDVLPRELAFDAKRRQQLQMLGPTPATKSLPDSRDQLGDGRSHDAAS